MLLTPARYPVALDVDESDLYAVQVAPRRDGVAVIAAGQFAATVSQDAGETATAFGKAVREALACGRFRGRTVSLHLPQEHVYGFPLRFTPAPGQPVDACILRELAKLLPFPIEEAVVDYPSLRAPAPGSRNPHSAMAFAVHRKLLDRYVDAASGAGANVEVVDCRVCSLIRVHRQCFPEVSDPTVLCYVGRTRTLVAMVTADAILAERHIAWGTDALVQRLLDNLSGERDNALTLLRDYGLVYDTRGGSMSNAEDVMSGASRAVYQLVSPLVEELVHDLHNLIGYVRAESTDIVFGRAFLYGRATLVRDLDRYVAGLIDLAVESVNPLGIIPVEDRRGLPDPQGAGACALALGLALRKVSWL